MFTNPSRLIGEEGPEPEALATMRRRGGRWAAYQNQDLGHPEIGHLAFLKIGEECTYNVAPDRHPDFPGGRPGWRYLLVGEVNLDTGKIV